MKSNLKLLFSILFIFCNYLSIAQNKFYAKSKINEIDKQTVFLQKKNEKNNEIVKKLAQKLQIEVNRKLSSGNFIYLKGINEIGEPIFNVTESNLFAGQTTHTNTLYEGGNLGIAITGSSIATTGRLGLWDGGKVHNTHVEFGNRVQQIDNTSSSSSHSTHVAGTMVAAGINATAKGMAPNAILKAWDYINDDTEMSAASKELLVSNHSYGQVAGWVYNDNRQGNQKWEWYGNNQISTYEDYKFGFYDSQSQTWDRIAYNAPNYLIVKSAGNKRNENGPGISPTDTTRTLEKYYLASSSDTSYVARYRNNGYDVLPTYSVAKNILTVGAVSIIPNGPNLASDIKISNFSSWGPTDDGRIKPDIVGAGVNLFSTNDNGNNSYTFLSGTSMSSPQVAGSIFLLQELYSKLSSGLMRSSTLKSLVLHTADDAGNPGPDYIYGWGLLNMEKAAKVLINNEKTSHIEELSIKQNGSFSKKFIANGKEPIIVTICWTDPESTPTNLTAANINSRIPKLINDLDINISDGKNKFSSWILDPNKPAENAKKGDNFRDNVEQVFIKNPVPGKEYTLTVNHKNLLTNGFQDYGLVISGIGGKEYCVSSSKVNSATKIDKVVINNTIFNASEAQSTFSDNTDIKLDVTANQKVDLEVIIGNNGVSVEKSLSIFADWNIDGDFDDIGEKLSDSKQMVANKVNLNIQIPNNLSAGINTRLRIISSESANIEPCGTFDKGETMDFLLSIVNPKIDLAISDLLYPDENICQNTSIDNLSILLNNKGINKIVTGSINTKIFENEVEIVNQKTNINTATDALSNSRINIPLSLILKDNSKYLFEFIAETDQDENLSNNAFSIERYTKTPELASMTQVVACSNNETVSLISNHEGAAFWYDNEINGNLIATGNNISINKNKAPTNFYVSLNDLAGTIGPVSKKEYSGGTYSGNFGPKPLITTKAPIRLESARLYIGNPGKIIFTVERTSDLTPVSTITLDVVPTRDLKLGNASNGQQLDDPKDEGAIYNLGLYIPEPGDYQISIEYEDGASIFRSNQGVSGFPFVLNEAVSITGSLFNGGVLKEAWYYFYNLKVKSLGCPSSKRILANNTTGNSITNKITATDGIDLCPGQNTILFADLGNNLQYQWFKDSLVINTANKNTLTVSQKGKYFVRVSENGVCPTASNQLQISLKNPFPPTITANANELTASEAGSYQWLLNRQPITNANNKIFTALATGSYSVQGLIDGCLLLSLETYVIILEDEKLKSAENVEIFPNPAKDYFYISGKNIKRNSIGNYQIFNALGTKISTGILNFKVDENLKIPTHSLPIGTYIINLEIDRNRYLKKLIKY